jgi:hypothetical protein
MGRRGEPRPAVELAAPSSTHRPTIPVATAAPAVPPGQMWPLIGAEEQRDSRPLICRQRGRVVLGRAVRKCVDGYATPVVSSVTAPGLVRAGTSRSYPSEPQVALLRDSWVDHVDGQGATQYVCDVVSRFELDLLDCGIGVEGRMRSDDRVFASQ